MADRDGRSKGQHRDRRGLTGRKAPAHMRASGEAQEKAKMVPHETDAMLARVLGDNLQAATFRLVVGAVAVSAVVALIVWLI